MSVRTLSLTTARAGLRRGSITLTVPARTALPTATLKKLILVRQGNEWTVSHQTPVAAGYGRSLRAMILGLSYKSARRISGSMNSYLQENFQDPSGER